AMTEDADFNPIQIKRLNSIYDTAKAKGIDLGVRHAASSAEVDHDPGSHLDMVRPGSALVGLEPMPNMDIRPVLGVKTRIIYVKDMEPGDSIGYHQAYKIEKPMRVATLPLGYSDGFALSSVNNANVLIKGKKYPMIALITANHISIDVTGSDDIEIGDIVTIIGKDGDEEITNTEYSNQTGGACLSHGQLLETLSYAIKGLN
ncbi:alanine racemase C-terminal domain-containing protein, partial [Emcibacteraceae bacterium]|nr:alanine racemase C-terminal domain-containing protein [Emcibacteraceae bacterium]